MSSTANRSSNNGNNSLPPKIQQLKDIVCKTRPEQIEDLWRADLPPNHPIKFIGHQHAENMGWWATEEEVSELLHDENRLEGIRQDLDSRALQIGMYGQSQYEELAAHNLIFYNPNCMGCNNPYDNPGACQHPDSPRPMPMMNPEINELAHDTLVILSVVNYLIAQEHVLTHTNKLALLLTPTRSQAGFDEMGPNGPVAPPICIILALMDNCSQAFPKIAHQAAGLLSLLICTSPAAAFSCLDGKAFVDSIWNYLSEIFRLVHNSECRVEEQFGVVAFLNILPSLYHFGNWNEAKASQKFNHFVAFLVSVIVNICHGATLAFSEHQQDNLEAIDDEPNNLEELPELFSAKVLMESLLLVKENTNTSSEGGNSNKPADWRIQFLHERPKTFTVVAGLEVLGWWIAKGIDLTLARVDCGDDPDETVQSCFAEYEPRIRLLMKGSGRNEELTSYIDPILMALKKNKKKVPWPDPSISLLYGPFIFDNRRCGLCQKTSEDTGKDLLRCSGGCGELQHYCCKDHQIKHWKKAHKFFCKRNATYSQYRGR